MSGHKKKTPNRLIIKRLRNAYIDLHKSWRGIYNENFTLRDALLIYAISSTPAELAEAEEYLQQELPDIWQEVKEVAA